VKGIILYDTRSNWEIDYVFNELLRDLRHWERRLVEIEALHEADIPPGVPVALVYNAWIHPLATIQPLVQQFRPFLLIQTSDEYGDLGSHMVLASDVRLMLRQYWHEGYTSFPNVHQIPLGYMSGSLNGSPSLDLEVKPPSERAYEWCFLGKIKQDREVLITNFHQLTGPSVVHTDYRPPWEMMQTYEDTIFIPNGRGWHTLDCLRLYEASLAGAIPVVVGDQEEIRTTFGWVGE
jgi:hypothetical protein